MAVDVIIDPSSGKIYWNDNAGSGTDQSIAIAGNASNKIEFIGYSGAFSGTSGSAPASPEARVVITDSASDTLIPGVNGYELGNSTNRWAVSATTLNASGAITLSYSPVTGVNTNHTLRITSVPFAEVSGAVIEMGATTAFDNSTANFFSGSANGTYLAIQAASTFSGNFLQFGLQDSTGARFSVGSSGSTSLISTNTTGSTTSSAFSLVANSITSGTGAYFASSSLTSGKIIDIAISGTAAANGKTGIYISATGTHAASGISTYGIIVDNQSTGLSSANFGIVSYAGAGTGTSLNIPLRLGLSTSKYVNFFVDSESGIRLSPQSNAFHFSLGPYGATAGNTSELRFMELSASGLNYVGFKAPDTIANNIIWTLPNVDGTTGQVLATNGTGTLSWATASGSVSVGGTNNGDIQYKSSTSLGGSANLNYDATNNELRLLNYNPTNSASTAALKILTGTTWTGSSNGTLIAGNAVTGFTGNLIDLRVAGNQKLQLNYNGELKIANAYTLPTTSPTEGQVLTFDGTNLVWAAGGTGGSGSGTVNSGASGKIAYYPSLGTVVDDASALDYATTGTNLTITASAIGVIPLAVSGISGQTASIFKAILNTTDAFVINNAGNISTGIWNASTIGVLYGGTGQTSYTNGQLLIGNTTGNTLAKATLTPGSGVDIANGAGSITIRQKRPLYLTFCSGFTPVASGVDSVVLRIPDSPVDGSTSISYNVRELFIRVETPSAGTTSIQVEYYTGTSAFTATNMMSAALSITGASTYEASTTSFSQTTLASGNKVRLNFTALNSTHANFFVQLLLEEA